VRTTTVDNDGVETIHKVKFQRSEDLSVITVSEFPDETILPHGFVIHWQVAFLLTLTPYP
jgi:hypothetical protein